MPEPRDAEWWKARAAVLDRELLAARSEIQALKVSRDVALKLAAWGAPAVRKAENPREDAPR